MLWLGFTRKECAQKNSRGATKTVVKVHLLCWWIVVITRQKLQVRLLSDFIGFLLKMNL
jgi:hypothetical protein